MRIPVALCFAVLTGSLAHAQVAVDRNHGAVFSEDDEVDAALERSVGLFLEEARSGEYAAGRLTPGHLDRFRFFFDALKRAGTAEGSTAPSLLKSYTFDDSIYYVTLSFGGVREGRPFQEMIVELEATPVEDHYAFGCPFERRTADFTKQTIGSVTYHHRGPLDAEQAKEFVQFRKDLCEWTGSAVEPLDYYCFGSLDELLQSYGLVHDIYRCNFLGRDLGFPQRKSLMFVTGTGNPNYAFEYVISHLEGMPKEEQRYGPMVIGMATYYGGYGLRATSISTLKKQFRKKLAQEPDWDLLEEFRKGRKSSLERHFCHYVMCSFLWEEVLEKRGFSDALSLVHTGSEGAEFFERLETLTGIDESGFHEAIVRLIAQ